ncbi:MAG: hypothetical protein JW839_15970, partial [Candidatus Lokiarchaeota archaeon]|nr:hypothetical protein [Candidatus Lokiarchaeota archaeon]
EDELFKTLGHKARRDIVKFIGKERSATFTSIKKALGNVESPALAYHLKSLSPLLVQKEGAYALSAIGIAAYKLLMHTSDAARVALGKRQFLYAYAITVASWIAAEFLIPFFVRQDPLAYLGYQVVINTIAVINWLVIWWLRKNF